MAKFTVGDSVLTPDRGVGLVKSYWPKGKNAPAHYSVEVDGSGPAVVYAEDELKPAPKSGTAVRCGDCRRGMPTRYTTNAVRCMKFRQLRSAGAPRECRHFRRRLIQGGKP